VQVSAAKTLIRCAEIACCTSIRVFVGCAQTGKTLDFEEA
jgi:hypothetical protein